MSIVRTPADPGAAYSKLVRLDNGLVFVAGQVGEGPDGEPVPGGIVPESHQMFVNLKAALAEEGLTLSDVVKATVWLVNPYDVQVFNEIYKSYFAGILPTRACVQACLMGPFNVEIEVIAYDPR